MAQKMFHESGQDGRSVLGTLAVQVEKDPRTGMTVVRSVTPVSPPSDAQTSTTIFDDGRKSIHAIGEVGGQPSSEELGQILSVIDGVGMKVLLDKAEVSPQKTETKMEKDEACKDPESGGLSCASEEKNMKFDSSGSYDMKAEVGIERCGENTENKKEEPSSTAVNDTAEEVDDETLVEGPVTLLFLGYADATAEQEDEQGGDGGMITVERVMITEEGEEHVIGPQTSPQGGKESREKGFQEIPLEGNGAGGKGEGEECDEVLQVSSSPAEADAETTPKRNTCKCCSVM